MSTLSSIAQRCPYRSLSTLVSHASASSSFTPSVTTASRRTKQYSPSSLSSVLDLRIAKAGVVAARSKSYTSRMYSSRDTSTDTATTAASSTLTEMTNKAEKKASNHPTTQTHAHAHSASCSHSHAHSHGLFSTHHHDHSEGAGEIMAALTGEKKDRGSRITILGLASNVGLTAVKGTAGIFMNSASLLAEAGHSLSDLLGDFVTLATWKLSRRPPSTDYPWGYGKFETVGTLGVSLILVGGAIGIGLHSYHLLLQVILPYLEALDPSSPLAQIVPFLPKSIPSPLLELFHDHASHAGVPHSHAHDIVDAVAPAGTSLEGALSDSHAVGGVLNPHAAWFALLSVVVKEWLYRATKKVADEEHSPVLLANAVHHRSDALTSGVALFSILGSAAGAPVLDPLGGLAVSFFILQQGLSLSKVAALEILDRGVDATARDELRKVVEPLISTDLAKGGLLGVRNVRAVKSGGLSSIDLTILVAPEISVRESHEIESQVRERIMTERRDAREVKIHIHGVEPLEMEQLKQEQHGFESDFGRDGC